MPWMRLTLGWLKPLAAAMCLLMMGRRLFSFSNSTTSEVEAVHMSAVATQSSLTRLMSGRDRIEGCSAANFAA